MTVTESVRMWGGERAEGGLISLRIKFAAAEAGPEAGAEAEAEAGAAVGGVRSIVLKAKSTTTTTKLNRTHREECSRRDELGGVDGHGRDLCRDVRAE